MCERDLSTGFREKLGRLGDCAAAAAQVVRVSGEIGRVRARGDAAIARVGRSELRLVAEGGDWKVDALVDPGEGLSGGSRPE